MHFVKPYKIFITDLKYFGLLNNNWKLALLYWYSKNAIPIVKSPCSKNAIPIVKSPYSKMQSIVKSPMLFQNFCLNTL